MKTKLFSLVLLGSQLHLFAGHDAAQEFVAHEWGTFTSVQGADGIQMEWNPLVISELPGFVFDRNRGAAGPDGRRWSSLDATKSRFATLQRMETPVIYFYSSKERSVDVTVKFPQGLITEWYPQVASLSSTDKSDLELTQQHGIRWSGVQVLPHASHQALNSLLPHDRSGSHYYAAREAESDFLQVDAWQKSNPEVQREKFLFYRGVGSFRAPLQVTLGASEADVSISNGGSEDLTDLFVLEIRKQPSGKSLAGRFTYVDRLPAGQNKTVTVDVHWDMVSSNDLQPQIAQRMRIALAARGLYGAEANAMVQTWQDSWFGEEGLRVLYLLPRKWTDQILPLTITPAPGELVRVMVGRAEMITPRMESQLLTQIKKFSEAGTVARAAVVTETRSLGLGRFAEPTLRRILAKTPGKEFSQQAWNLLNATKAPPAAAALVAK